MTDREAKRTQAGIEDCYAKTGEYKDVLDSVIDSAKCPFCPDNFKFHKKPILRREGGWLITENSWPYENARQHLLLIPDWHMTEVEEITPDDWETVRSLMEWIRGERDIRGGGLTLRFGTQNWTGSSVAHLHFHLIVPELDESGSAKPVYFPIG